MFDAIKNHWQEYLIEAWCLGTFMVSAATFGVLIFSPTSPVSNLNLDIRNILMGLAMGVTAVAIIKSPWGKRSGAHFNPAVTLALLRLGKISRANAMFYIAFQFIGGVAGALLSWFLLGDLLADSAVNYVVTVPGVNGPGVAFVAEAAISFVMMSAVLLSADTRRLSNFTPFIAGSLLAFYITIESPLSGTSMNPARTFASAIVSGVWTDWWIYFMAPPIAMLVAAEFFLRTRGLRNVVFAKLMFWSGIFGCGYYEHNVATEDVD